MSAEPTNAFDARFTSPLYLGSALNPINSSMIATALAAIAIFLHMPAGRVAVLVSSLYLACAIAQPTAGKLSEAFGPRRIFLCGIALVFVGGLLGGLGDNLALLIIARVVIGIGTSAGYPSAMLLVRRRAQAAGMTAPPGGVLGGLQIAGMATASLGLPLGGVLVAAFGWRSVFWVNLPLAAVTLIVALLWLPGDEAVPQMTVGEISRRIDLPGIGAFAVAMIPLLIFLDGLPSAHWLWLGIAAAGTVVFILQELRAEQPFIDLRLLAGNRALLGTYLRVALMALCVYLVLYGVSEWLEVARSISTQGAGLLILPSSLVPMFLTRSIAKASGVRIPLLAAPISAGLGGLGLLLVNTTSTLVWVIVVSAIFGVTMATFSAANQTVLYRQTPPEQIGTASGLLRTFMYLGSIASSAVIGIVFHTNVTDAGLHTVAWIMVAVAVIALGLTLSDESVMGVGVSSPRLWRRPSSPSPSR